MINKSLNLMIPIIFILVLFISGCVESISKKSEVKTFDDFCKSKGYLKAWPDNCTLMSFIIGNVDVPEGSDGKLIGSRNFFDEVIIFDGTDLCPKKSEGIFCVP